MIKSRFIIILSVFGLFSCARYEKEIDRALEYAGDNRGELETVLNHYSNSESDSLKYRAACFLISAMPYHQSLPAEVCSQYCMSLDSLFRQKMDEAEYNRQAQAISRRYSSAFRPDYDIRTISSDYLISEIDRAFFLWETRPFLRHLTFDEFCEYVLPYKCLEGQPLDGWRDSCLVYGEDMSHIYQIDEYRYNARRWVEAANRDLEDSCKMTVWGTDNMNILPIYDVSVLARRPYGSCKEMAQLVLLNCRAKGLPVALDFNPNWPDRAASHYWNSILTDNHTGFDFEGLGYPGNVRYMDNKYGKVFRMTYSPHPLLLEAYEKERWIPSSLQLFSKDVTAEYERVTDVLVRVSDESSWEFAYLAVFDNSEWIPVDVGRVVKGRVEFRDVPTGILYIVGTYGTGRFEPISEPFILDSRGRMSYCRIGGDVKNMRLRRKFPAFGHIHWVNEWLRGGLIEASDRPDFRDADSLTSFPNREYLAGEVSVSDTISRRYWRLISTSDKSSDFAELYFYERGTGRMLKGKLIHGNAAVRDPKHDTPEHLFDNDPLTYFAVENRDSTGSNELRWAGYDFGHPVSVESVGYIRRGDGNDICPGDVYELYYWADGGWQLHQKKKAEHVYIDFEDVPSDALYFIRDSTRGAQNRTFIYDKDEVIWY